MTEEAKEKRREYLKQYRLSNKDKIKEYQRNYISNNKEFSNISPRSLKYKLALITDGRSYIKKRKVEALNIEDYFG